MKKIMLAGLLLAMSSIAMADSAQDVLKKARDDYYKQKEAEKKVAREPKKVEKAKKIMGIVLLAFAIGQVSMAEKTDPNIERLLKIAKQKKAAEEKEARKQELLNSVTEEGETVPVTVVSPSKTAPKTNEKLEAKKNKEAEARKQKAEAKAMKAKYKNMSESEKMDVEIQRIKKRVNEINSNIETFHKTNEMLDKMEQRLEGIETKLK